MSPNFTRALPPRSAGGWGSFVARSGSFHDSVGERIGRASTDSSGRGTNYDSRGRVISHESTSGNTTTV